VPRILDKTNGMNTKKRTRRGTVEGVFIIVIAFMDTHYGSAPPTPRTRTRTRMRKSERRWASGRARAVQRRAARPRNLVIRRAGDCNNRPSSGPTPVVVVVVVARTHTRISRPPRPRTRERVNTDEVTITNQSRTPTRRTHETRT